MPFASPSVLFLTTANSPERAYARTLLGRLREQGYTRFAELCCGAYSLPLTAVAAGWKPGDIECSDVSLYSAAIGAVLSGTDLHDLGVRLDGEPVELPDADPADQAAFILWLQLLTRMQVKSEVTYWRELADDLMERAVEHQKAISAKLRGLEAKLSGVRFRSADLWDHLAGVADDEHTIVSLAPPTYCLAADQRVLTEDLRWVRVGEIKTGDRLTGFDEEAPRSPGKRWYRPAIVTRSEALAADCVRVVLGDGSEVICTPDHPWLTDNGWSGASRRWVKAADLMMTRSRGPMRQGPLYALRGYDVWHADTSRDGGWLAGMYDGEGNLNDRRGPKGSTQLHLSQKPGPVLALAEALLRERGFKPSLRSATNASQLSIGNAPEVARALGSLRPIRLLSKWSTERGVRIIDRVPVVAVEPAGRRMIQSLTTSTGTYIGEGFLMHNTSGYEKFYDTKGRLTWDEPEYQIWDAETDLANLHDFMADKPALLLCSEQREPGHAVGTPVFARHLALGQYVYITTNHPETVLPAAGGPKVYPKRSGGIHPGDVPVIAPDAEITAGSKTEFLQVKADVADYYRGLWMHRLTAAPGSYNLLVVIDGRAAGVIGYSVDPVVRPYSMDSRWASHMLLRFAFGAPHVQLRLGRLMTMLALQEPTARRALTHEAAIYLAASEGLCTVNYTRHPESKFYRGLMKLAARQDHPDGYKLTYAAPWQHQEPDAVLAEFLRREAKWRESSKKD